MSPVIPVSWNVMSHHQALLHMTYRLKIFNHGYLLDESKNQCNHEAAPYAPPLARHLPIRPGQASHAPVHACH